MPLDTLSANLNAIPDQRYIDGWVAAANAANQTPDEFLKQFIRDQGRVYAVIYKVGNFPSAAFVMRFTNSEITAIREAAVSDENVAAILAELQAEPSVAVDDPRVDSGLDYLVGAGLLTPERRLEVVAYQRPEPLDLP